MIGKLYGVSTGPGDPELMTVKSIKTIEKCGVIAVPRTKGENALALSIVKNAVSIECKEILMLDFPMTRDRDELCKAWRTAADRIEEYLAKGDDIAMLCLGDISVYSTFSYTAELVKADGYETVCIPGVTSFCAAAAEEGNPLVCGDSPLIVIPSGCTDRNRLIDEKGTKVIMKPGKKLDEIKTLLKGRNVSAAVNCGMESSAVYKNAEDIPSDSGYFTIITVRE